MNEIILIEDRPGRQAQYLDIHQKNRLIDKPYLSMPMEEDCRRLLDDINGNNTSALIKYSLIIIHRSSLNGNGLRAITDLCKFNKIDLIQFSGGVSQINYTSERYQSLVLSPKGLYNDTLESFLEKYSFDKSTSLLELIYKSRWKLELMLRHRLLKTIASQEEEGRYKLELEEEISSLEKNIGVSADQIDLRINSTFASL